MFWPSEDPPARASRQHRFSAARYAHHGFRIADENRGASMRLMRGHAAGELERFERQARGGKTEAGRLNRPANAYFFRVPATGGAPDVLVSLKRDALFRRSPPPRSGTRKLRPPYSHADDAVGAAGHVKPRGRRSVYTLCHDLGRSGINAYSAMAAPSAA